MKIELEEVKETAFQPRVIKLTIESEQELSALAAMCLLDVSIPEIVQADMPNKSYYSAVATFLDKLNKVL